MIQTVLLGDVAEVLGGGTPSTKNSDFWGGDIPWITPRDLSTHHDVYISSGERNITEKGLSGSSAKLLPEGSVIFSSRAPIGYVTIASVPMTTNQGCKGIISDEVQLHNKFLYYWLKHNKEHIEGVAGGSTFKEISTTGVRNLNMTLPDLESQKKIANILGTLDEKIELNRQMNETLEQMGQALFRHYFIDNPEAEKWDRKTIGELCDVKIGRTPPRKESEWFDKNDGETWVSIKDMGQGTTFISDSSEYLTGDAVAKFNVPTIEPNTLLLSFKLTVGRLCISTKRMYSNEAIAQLPLRVSDVSIEYLYYFLRNFNYSQLSSTSSIATAVNSTTVKNIKVTIPTKTAMNDFTAQAHDILEAVKNNEAEIQTLTTLRDTLLPGLISGKVKISE